MGIFSMKGYNKPGKGVDDLAPGNDGAMLFFEIFIRKFWKLIQTNLLFCVANIPAFLIIYFLAGTFSNAIFGTFPNEIAGIVGLSEPDLNNADYRMIYMIIDIGVRVCAATLFTIFWGSGPATAGMHYILRNYAREENAFILSDFWDAIKDNFKQSLAVFIIDILFMFIFFYGIYFYSSQTNILRFAKYILYCLFIFYTIVHLFIYPLMVRYKLSLGKLLKNAALFSMASLLYSFLVIILLGLLTIGIGYLGIFMLTSTGLSVLITIYVLLVVVILFAFCGFIVSYNAECQIRKYIDGSAQVEEKESFKKEDKPINRRQLY